MLVGGTILAGLEQPSYSAVAWAEGTVLALGTDEQVRGVSRGDSHVVELHGAFVVPIGADPAVRWPPDAMLEIGGPADLAVLLDDPRVAGLRQQPAMALLRSGHVVRGSLPSG